MKLRKNENVISLLKDNMNVKSTELTSSSEKNNTSYVYATEKICLVRNGKKAKESFLRMNEEELGCNSELFRNHIYLVEI
jgi:hypothetical protein